MVGLLEYGEYLWKLLCLGIKNMRSRPSILGFRLNI